MERLVGKVGEVVVRVRGDDGPGEVRLTYAGAVETYIAYAHREVPVGRRVLVVHDRGARAVDVVPWDVEEPGQRPPAGAG